MEPGRHCFFPVHLGLMHGSTSLSKGSGCASECLAGNGPATRGSSGSAGDGGFILLCLPGVPASPYRDQGRALCTQKPWEEQALTDHHDLNQPSRQKQPSLII